MPAFEVVSPFAPAGDQGPAIAALARGLANGYRYQTLKGVTGSGKTFSMAKIIEHAQVPTLVISHNKTLAAQLYREFTDFLPRNAVEYFVSYYDYYQPEAYVASRDLYIEKDASINDEIERLRLGATTALMERRDVVVVATVSCIYGLGSPDDYRDLRLEVAVGAEVDPRRLMRRLVGLQYTRNDAVLVRAGFRRRGDVIEVLPPHAKEGLRIEFFGDEIERLRRIDPLSGNTLAELEFTAVYPAKHFVTPEERLARAVESIREELTVRHEQLLQQGRLVEAQRLKTRCEYDLEMLAEIGYCSGVENYSRHLSGRQPGERPAALLDFFPREFLVFIDEVARHGAAGGSDVRGRSLAQGSAGRAWVPAALGPGQPAAHLRRVRGAAGTGDLRLRHPGGAGAARLGAGGGTGDSSDPVCSIPRSKCATPPVRSKISTPRCASVPNAMNGRW